jgi:hypothetical protein
MKITTRRTFGFIELKVDENETTLFKSNPDEIKDVVKNLLDVIDELSSYSNKSVKEYLNELGF